jgi:chromosome segregation ATPase
MIGPYLELVIIAIILGTIVWLSRRDGAANPVGTGKLLHDVSSMRQEHVAHGRRLQKLEEATASAKDVEELSAAFKEQQARIETIERQVGGIAETGTATARRVRHIDQRQDKMAEDIASVSADVRASSKQIDRIYDVLVPKGMER